MTEPRSTNESVPTWAWYVLGGLAIVMALLAAYQGSILYSLEEGKLKSQHWSLLVWSAFNAVVAGLSMLWLALPRPSAAVGETPTAPTKLLMLGVGGFLGLSTVALGLVYVFQWWDVAVGGLFTGREAWKGGATWEHWRPYIVVGLILVGLAVMFISLLAVRSEERNNPTLRRLFYGYNAVLTGLLMLAILGTVNVFAFFYLQDFYDWTETHVYSISDKTKNILKTLDKPVVVYTIISSQNLVRDDMARLLANFASVNRDIIGETVSPDDFLSIMQLRQKYDLRERQGVLVIYDPEGANRSEFISLKDLQEISMGDPRMGGDSDRNFKGEQALISAIQAVKGAKVKTTVYFTQDSGELSLEDSSPAQQADVGLGKLKMYLQETDYAPKPLALGAVTKVPEDAMAVAIVGPTKPFTPEKLDVLREYLKQNGRLLVLVDGDPQRDPSPTGLEPLLEEYGVKLGQDLVLNGNMTRAKTQVAAMVAPTAELVFREAFRRYVGLPFLHTRSVAPAPGGSAGWTALPLFQTIGPEVTGESYYHWAETKPKALLANNDEFDTKRRQKTDPITIAVTVRGKRPADSKDVHAEGMPRMVVFGDSTFVSNALIDRDTQIGALYYNLFTSSLAWLRDKPEEVEGVPPTKRTSYRANLTAEQRGTLYWTPGIVLLLTITACGVGVWIMRRR